MTSSSPVQLYTIAAFVSTVLLLIYRWATATFTFFRQRDVPFQRPWPLLGNMANVMMRRQTSLELGLELYNKFRGYAVYGFYRFRRPMIVITDPQVIRLVLVQHFDHFTNHRDLLLPPEQEPLLGNALIMLKDQKWRDMRSTMSSAFTGSKMRHMYGLIQRSVDGTMDALRSECAAESVSNRDYVPELKDRFVRFMSDVIASTSFGVEINSLRNPNNEFFVMGQNAIRFRFVDLIKVGVMLTLPRLSSMLRLQVFAPEIHKFFHHLVHDAIAERRKHSIHRPDIIHLLMEKQSGRSHAEPNAPIPAASSEAFAITEEASAGQLRANEQRTWTDAELTSQCFVFFIAGFETSSTLLSCACQELAENPDIQERLRAEIDNVRESLNDGEHVGYDRLQRMTYMDMVVSEALRKWPPTASTDRECVKPYKLVTGGGNSFWVDVGDCVMVPILALHRDERFWPEPMRFDPERFSAERRKTIVPFTYLPFGGGPRTCIASRFALITIKSLLFELLSSFELCVASNTQIPLRLLASGFKMTAENGFNVHLRPRICKQD